MSLHDVSRSLSIAQAALDEAGHLDCLGGAVRLAVRSVTLIAGDCLFPLAGGVRLVCILDPLERAQAALRFTLQRLDLAQPLCPEAVRALAGVRFILQAVLAALESELNPEAVVSLAA